MALRARVSAKCSTTVHKAIRLAETLRALRDLLNPPQVKSALCQINGTNSPPSLFHRDLFPELMELHGDMGGKELIRAHLSATAFYKTNEPSWDIDRPEDWKRFLEAYDE